MPVWAEKSPEYRVLLNDLLVECNHYDGFNETSGQIEEFKKQLNLIISSPTFSGKLPVGDSWNSIWPPKVWSAVETAKQQKIKVRHVDLKPFQQHSIFDITSFVKNRIGEKVTDLIKKRKIEIVVVAGNEKTLSQLLINRLVIEIPSFYSSWGIKKYFLIGQNGEKPTVVFLIPPIREYLDHYGYMLEVLDVHPRLFLDESARLSLKNSFIKEVDDFSKILPIEGSHVVFGYTKQIDSILSSKKMESYSVKSSCYLKPSQNTKVFGRVYQLVNQVGKELRIIALGAGTTLWGEATQFLVDGVLRHNPSSLAFLGSAGSISGKGNIYGISVPREFFLNKHRIAITNKLNFLLLLNPSISGDFVFSTSHGNSKSPAEQSRAYVDETVSQGIDTIDVETSLVASAVAEHNKQTFESVDFLVANLITDKPYYLQGKKINDLDNVNVVQKQVARMKIVNSVLSVQSKIKSSVKLPKVDFPTLCRKGGGRAN